MKLALSALALLLPCMHSASDDTVDAPVRSAPSNPVYHSAPRPPVLTTETAGEREARAVIDRADAFRAACALDPQLECAVVGLDPSHPCDPPRRIAFASLAGDVTANAGKWLYDGRDCYQATAEHPGACTWLHRCQAWSSLAACRAARALCAERGR